MKITVEGYPLTIDLLVAPGSCDSCFGVGWVGGADNEPRHLHSSDTVSLMFTCTLGLTSRMCPSRDVLITPWGLEYVSGSLVTCTMGLTAWLCFARDALHYVMEFGTIRLTRFMFTCILDGEVCLK